MSQERRVTRRTRALRAVLVAVGVVVAALALGACEPPPPPKVVVYGDSLIAESEGLIRFLGASDYEVDVRAQGGAALCDFHDLIVEETRRDRPDVVVVSFSGNIGTPCMGDVATFAEIEQRYAEDASALIEEIEGFGAQIALMVPPPALQPIGLPEPLQGAYAGADSVGAQLTPLAEVSVPRVVGALPAGFETRVSSVDPAYRRVAAEWHGRGVSVAVLDGYTPLAAPSGGWTKVAVCGAWEQTAQGCRDGLVDVRGPDLAHFCPLVGAAPCPVYSAGAFRYAAAVVGYLDGVDRRPFGNLDAVKGGSRTIEVSGWAIDPGGGWAPTDVHVYVDGRFAATVTADRSRPDVALVYPGYGPDHGYVAGFPATAGRHEVCVYAIDAYGLAERYNPGIGCTSVVVGTGAPFGNVEIAQGAPGGVDLQGWAIDPDAPVEPVAVQVYVDGQVVEVLTADRERADVAAAYPGTGTRHGFAGRVPATPGVHQLCVVLLDGYGPTPPDHVLLHCRIVTVSAPPPTTTTTTVAPPSTTTTTVPTTSTTAPSTSTTVPGPSTTDTTDPAPSP